MSITDEVERRFSFDITNVEREDIVICYLEFILQKLERLEKDFYVVERKNG